MSFWKLQNNGILSVSCIPLLQDAVTASQTVVLVHKDCTTDHLVPSARRRWSLFHIPEHSFVHKVNPGYSSLLISPLIRHSSFLRTFVTEPPKEAANHMQQAHFVADALRKSYIIRWALLFRSIGVALRDALMEFDMALKRTREQSR